VGFHVLGFEALGVGFRIEGSKVIDFKIQGAVFKG